MNTVPQNDASQKRKRAWVRLILGQVQMLGATVTLILLLLKGVCAPVIWGVVLTGLVSLASRVLFHFIWKEGPGS